MYDIIELGGLATSFKAPFRSTQVHTPLALVASSNLLASPIADASAESSSPFDARRVPPLLLSRSRTYLDDGGWAGERTRSGKTPLLTHTLTSGQRPAASGHSGDSMPCRSGLAPPALFVVRARPGTQRSPTQSVCPVSSQLTSCYIYNVPRGARHSAPRDE
ncbi:hypothetical protein CC85DRAFT_120049 [Cutaneotrichosporon oleaginosum]|uniref:Uncharacterized protein n=1 Tax=Cutaneotrichosporon oleaginosum TaxID=879819 RepID=A0A0J0XKC7_9TREE|nr:uncharacterized protein CC85DRAFT_120049 [Cutaneotrichosporon oleaginosum]KLT41517.1 hypothetical protein CC85DRAFT_120049 [Cutaneotrichosporon oleaginosum]TXT05834.1 hypothetical protein COLE_07154 [Cutaneotrichosporon oleaginosum]